MPPIRPSQDDQRSPPCGAEAERYHGTPYPRLREIYFRKMVQMRLEYDNGTPSYLTDVVNEAPDYDSYMYEYEEVGNGMIIEETVVSYLGYKSAMDNFQMGFEKSKDQIEKVWKDVNVVGVVAKGQTVKKEQLTREQIEMDGLEKGLRVAVLVPCWQVSGQTSSWYDGREETASNDVVSIFDCKSSTLCTDRTIAMRPR
jgi:hypothetical protein